METNYQKFLSGEYCNRLDAEVLEMIVHTGQLLARFNAFETTEEEKEDLLIQMLGKIGQHTSVGHNFTCQCGKHIFLGEKTVVNINCTMMDENHIRIGNRVLIAPNVHFYTATHPVEAYERFVSNWQETSGDLFFRTRSLPITIGNDVWIGGGTIILPGVSIGNNCVIGAGSVVNKSIPANSEAAGNPCRIIRRLEPAITFRPATTADIPELKELFRNTVLTINARNYTAEEVTDWASCGNRPNRWEELLATLYFIAACDAEGRIVGFTSIRNDGYLHSMFIHKDHQEEGIATALLQQIEAYAKEHGIREITSEVSITARPFFEHRGYTVEREQQVQANRLQLTNYVMRKVLPSSLTTQTENKQQTAQQSNYITPRYRLRSWETSDAPSLAKYLNNKKIWDNCRDRLPFPYTEADARSFIDHATSLQEPSEYCIEINGEAAGNISFMRGTDVERFNAEAGYWLAEPFWNQGIASEALHEALRHYLAATDVVRVFANVYESNIASMRVLEKVGFRKVDILRKACFKNDCFINAHYFELLKEDFV